MLPTHELPPSAALMLPPPATNVRATSFKPPKQIAHPRVLVTALIAGAAVDQVLRAKLGIGAAVFPIVIVGLLIASGAMANRTARWLAAPIVVISPWLALRTQPTALLLNQLTIAALLIMAVSLGRNRRLFTLSGAAWGASFEALFGSLVTVFPFIGNGLARVASARHWSAHQRGAMRGVAIALPGVVIVTILLATADRAFASLFDWMGGRLVGHVVVTLLAAIPFAALALVASTKMPVAAAVDAQPTMRRAEATAIVAAYVVVDAAFVASRLLRVTPSETATDISDAARAGFFQLVAVAAITLAVLGWVRAKAAVSGMLRLMVAAAIGLTLTIVGIAIHRLDVYRDRFGLTELRLGTTWFSWWLGLLFVMLGVSTIWHVGRRRWCAAVLASALGWLVGWNALNPDAMIARANIERVGGLLASDATGTDAFDAEVTVPVTTPSGETAPDATGTDVVTDPGATVAASATLTGTDLYDGGFTVSLSDDAVPVVVELFDRIPADQQPVVRDWVCAGKRVAPGGLAWNHSKAAARRARVQFCREA